MRGFRGGPPEQISHVTLQLAERLRGVVSADDMHPMSPESRPLDLGAVDCVSAIANVRSVQARWKRRRSWKRMNSRRI